MRRIIYLLLPLLFLNFYNIEAKHYSGAEILWEKVGVDTFKVSIAIFRNCSDIEINAVGIKVSSTCTTYNMVAVKDYSKDISPVCQSQCTTCDTSTCSFSYGIEYTVLSGLIYVRNLRKSNCCDVVLSHLNCCRDQTMGIPANSDLYIEAKLNICLPGDNSSPVFKHHPVNVICLGKDAVFNIGADDGDRDSISRRLSDSLVYSWTCPKTSATSTVSYTGKFDCNKPISYLGFPNTGQSFPRGIHLDSSTGALTFRPMQAEIAIFAYKIEEYRNGVKIGEVSREHYVAVIKCPNNSPPKFSGLNNLSTQKFEINTCPGVESCFYIHISDKDALDTLYYSYESNLPNFSNKAKTMISNGDSIPICYTPDSMTALHGQYYIDISIEDNACPVVGKASKRIIFNIGKPIKPDYVLHKKTNSCGEYSYELVDKNGGIFSHVSWAIDGKETSSDGVKMTHHFTQQGTYIVSAQVKGCYQDTITDTVKIISLPQLSITGLRDTSLCAQDSIRLPYAAKSSNGIKSLQWNIKSRNKQTPKVYYDSTHWYLLHKQTSRQDSLQVVFTLTDSQNCVLQKEIRILSKGTFQPDSAISAIRFCATLDSTIALETFHPNAVWSGRQVSSNQLIHKFPWKAGVFPIEYRAQTDSACYYKYEEYVVIPASPATWTGDTSLCGDTSRFLLKNKVPGIWRGNNIVQGKIFSPIGTSNEKIIFQPTVIYQKNRCFLADTITIRQSTTSDEILTSDTTLCEGGSNIALKTRSLGLWSGANIENSVEFNPSSLGKYELIFAPQSSSKCLIDDTMYIEVVKNTNSIVVPDTIMVCVTADTLTVEGNTKGGSWSGFGIISSTPKIRILPADLGLGGFDFIYTDEDDKGCLAKDTTRIEVGDLPLLNFSVLDNKFDIKDDSLEIRNNGSNSSDIAFAWYLNDDKTPFSTEFEPKHEITVAGVYSILLVALNIKTGCTDSLQIMDAFTAEDIDGIGANPLNHQISIFPNPANSTITISNEHSSAIQLELIDLSGKVVMRKTITTGQSQLKISDLASGFYQAFFNSGDQMIVKKLIKK